MTTSTERLGWIDAAGGVAGDMLLGASLDALPRRPGEAAAAAANRFLRGLLRRLGLPGVHATATEARRGGFRGLRIDVRFDEARQPHARSLADVRAVLRRARLPARVRERAAAVFLRLAEAEAEAHGLLLRRVHLHEVGAVDAIVDITGVAAALAALGIDRLRCSPLPMGSGCVRCAHGALPLPAPAVALLLRGLPVHGTTTEGETVTPTGAALVAVLTESFGPLPALIVDAVGVGAGLHDRPGVANLTRLFLGRAGTAPPPARTPATDVMVEANIDDMTPDLYEHAMERLFAAGAVDAFVTPILMKKGRPAHKLSALVERDKVEAVVATLFRETTSIGCRIFPVEKRALERVLRTVRTPWGPVPVKFSLLGDEVLGRRPEHDVCRRLARAAGVPLRVVVEAAAFAARDLPATRRNPTP